MKDFLYIIKSKGEGGLGNWSWPPLFTGKVNATNKKEAKILIEEDYGRKFPLRVLSKDLQTNEFLLSIREIEENDEYTNSLFEINVCKQCGKQFKLIEKYTFNNTYGGKVFCDRDCSNEWNVNNGNYVNGCTFSEKNLPIIYKITNKTSGMCYIGKTRQIFTLRWYQHFFQTTGTKFHKVIRDTPITDWLFEVIEIVLIPESLKDQRQIDCLISEREQFYIVFYDSVLNGYNSR